MNMKGRTAALWSSAAVLVLGALGYLLFMPPGPFDPYGYAALIIYFAAVVYAFVIKSTDRFWINLGQPFTAAAYMMHGTVVYFGLYIYTSLDMYGTGVEAVWFMSMGYLILMDLFALYSAWKRKEAWYAVIAENPSKKHVARHLRRSGFDVTIEGDSIVSAMGSKKVKLTFTRKRGKFTANIEHAPPELLDAVEEILVSQ